MLKKIILTGALLLCLALFWASELTQSMEEKIKSTADETAALELVRQYISQTEDIEDLRMLQNYWLSMSPVECREYFSGMKTKHPQDPKYIYLWARSLEDISAQKQAGRNLIKKFPSFEYGYRLLLAYYQKNLLIYPDATSPEAKPYLKDFKQDRKYFAQYMKKFPNNESAYYLNISLLVWENKISEANAMLSMAADKNFSWLNWQYYTDYYFNTNQLLMLETYIRSLIATSDATKNMTDEQKENQVAVTYLGTLFDNEAFDDLFSWVKSHPTALQISPVQRMYILACVHTGDPDRAFDFLELLSTQSGDLYSWLESDEELQQLRLDGRWGKIITRIRDLWDLDESNRRTEAVSMKISKPAPLWELLDAQGNTVKLADLKGRIVVLDFWATWCDPCKMAMPHLDKWMKTKMPAAVKVYSINVWERDLNEVPKYWGENDYAMTLLYGTQNLSTDYGFDGIPYLCVIDREGNIRYELKGYMDGLEEFLQFWTEDLLY
jgi:thiol-disulfide isomerase/thioredoxin